MRLTVLGLLAGVLPPCAAALAGNPQAAGPKDGEFIKLEARGTVRKSSPAAPAREEVFVLPPNPCAGSYFFEKEMEAYTLRLELAKVQPRIARQPRPAPRAT